MLKRRGNPLAQALGEVQLERSAILALETPQVDWPPTPFAALSPDQPAALESQDDVLRWLDLPLDLPFAATQEIFPDLPATPAQEPAQVILYLALAPTKAQESYVLLYDSVLEPILI